MVINKAALKKLYKSYIYGEKIAGINWEKYIPIFAKNIPESERELIHQHYLCNATR